MMPPLPLSFVKVFSKPFPHAVSRESFGLAINQRILGWLESEAPWCLVETDFYEQYEFSLLDIQLPPDLAFLRSPLFLESTRTTMADLFGATLDERIDATAHRLVSGQTIRLHNDYIAGAETHRLLIQLNRGWNEESGGFLLLFESADASDVSKVLRPLNNSALAFAISPDSYHAVSTLQCGERFTLVYSFYG